MPRRRCESRASQPAHETQYAKTADGLYIAYQVVGSGPIDRAMDFHAFTGNVDLIWQEPDWGPILVGLTEFARLIIHDRRGSGASSRNVPPPNLETRAADLLLVLDVVGSATPVLGAAASTGAMHGLFAATKPDWTSGLTWNRTEAPAAQCTKPRSGTRRQTPAPRSPYGPACAPTAMPPNSARPSSERTGASGASSAEPRTSTPPATALTCDSRRQCGGVLIAIPP